MTMTTNARLSRPYETDQPFQPYQAYRPQNQPASPQRKPVASTFKVEPVYDGEFSGPPKPLEPTSFPVLSLKPTTFSRFTSWVNDLWLLEFGSLLVSIVAVAALAEVLRLYDGRPLDDWKHTLRINTVASFIAIIAKATLVMAVSSAMGQLKWTWYASPRSKRSLADFQAFDDASRGPWGSLKLLFRRPDLAFIAAFVILAALSFEAFVQQTINTPLLPVVSTTNSTIPIASQYNQVSFGVSQALKQPELALKAAMSDGLFYSNLSQTANTVTPQCGTGNCTYPQYRTLSVCSKCIDTSSLVKSQEEGCAGLECGWILPNGVNITGQSGVLSTSTGLLNTNELNTELDVISAFSAIGRNSSYTSAVTAVDCILYYCVQTYSASVANGAFQENPLNSFRITDRVDPSLAYYALEATLGDAGSELGKQTFKVDGVTRLAVQLYTQSLLTGYVLSTEGEIISSSDAILALYDHNPAKLPQSIQNLATSMSSRIRTAAGENTIGQASELVTFIEVRWAWLLMPLGLELLTLLTVVGTIILTARRKVPAWKVSALAPMFHGIDQETATAYRTEKMDELVTVAEKLHVTLVQDDCRRSLRCIQGPGEDELPLNERVAFAGSETYDQPNHGGWHP